MVDQHKLQSIVEWVTLTSCTKVQSFKGLSNYYCLFVEGYCDAKVGAQLTALDTQKRGFTLSPEAQASFDLLKQAPLLGSSTPHVRLVSAGGTDEGHE